MGGCGKLTALGVDAALAVWNWACNWEEKCYWLYFIIDCNKARLALCYSDFRVTGPHTGDPALAAVGRTLESKVS